MKSKKKLVSYVRDSNVHHAVLHAKNPAVARFHRNELGLYTKKWWHVRVGHWDFVISAKREDAVIKALLLFSDLDLASPEAEKKLACWRRMH